MLATVAIARLAFPLACVVVVAVPRFAFRCLLHIRIVVINDDHRVASFALSVLGMAGVGGTRVVRVVRVLGPAFFVAGVLAGFANPFAVFDNDYLTGIGVLLAGGRTGCHRGDRQYNQE